MTDTEFIWACGLFEGEGHIGHRRNKDGYWHRSLELGSTDRDVLLRAHAAFGVGKVYAPRMSPGRTKPFSVWRCSRWSALQPLLEQMLPWLGERRKAQALALLANPPKAGYSDAGPRNTATHCWRGHPWTGPGSDVHIKDGNYRRCRACGREIYALRRAGVVPKTYRHVPLDSKDYPKEVAA